MERALTLVQNGRAVPHAAIITYFTSSIAHFPKPLEHYFSHDFNDISFYLFVRPTRAAGRLPKIVPGKKKSQKEDAANTWK